MAKNIILCSDGTGNADIKGRGTNVFKLFEAVDLNEHRVNPLLDQQLAFYDPLTRLPNRLLLMERLQHALATEHRSGRGGALMFIDLDNFKTLNDTLSHGMGDLLLQPIYHAQMAKEAGHFDIGDVVEAITEKLIRRHPHVFGDVVADGADDAQNRWEAIKVRERAAKAARKGDAWLADRVYSAVPATDFGRAQEVAIGPLSGKSNVVWWLERRGLPVSDAAVRERLRRASAARHGRDAAAVDRELAAAFARIDRSHQAIRSQSQPGQAGAGVVKDAAIVTDDDTKSRAGRKRRRNEHRRPKPRRAAAHQATLIELATSEAGASRDESKRTETNGQDESRP